MGAVPIFVETPGGRYPIFIGAGELERLPRTISRLGKPSGLHVVSDARVLRAWGSRLSAALERTGLPVSRSVVPAGERSKSAARLERLWREIVRAGCDRRAWLVAFGGGVVGDLAGFAAASVLRGIEYLQIPTTLLAMVDSSVGGKTGINLPEGKNLVGAFHQPKAVVMDPDLLRTLPEREIRAGWAEVIKTAAILDARLFRSLESGRDPLLAREPRELARAVRATALLKAQVVRRDEREAGLRRILNFGHTLGHAIETARGYARLLHGEAVAVGMVFAARLGEELGASPAGTAERIERLIAAFGLPTRPPALPLRALLAAVARDKKRGPRGLCWVLLGGVGKAVVRDDVPWPLARRAIERFLAR